MAVPAALIAAGTFTQILGRYGANLQQALAERANAKFYAEQAQFARLAAERAERVAEFDYTHKIGEQISTYAGAGVDMSGSAEVTVGATVANAVNEIMALRAKGKLDVALATMRSQQAAQTASTLESPGYNLLQGGASLLTGFGGFK